MAIVEQLVVLKMGGLKMLEELRALPIDELRSRVKSLRIPKIELVDLVLRAGGYVTSRDTVEVLKQRLVTAIIVDRTHVQILGNARP